ncbi:MAG: hypothetical protein JXC32_22030 [Anaerolineae bacterium]|nr:hypothetical protein [Anaerolineae bacterium]
MAYFNTLLLYLGFGGSLLLLGLGSVPPLRHLRKPLSAVWLTILTLVFCLSPATGRWVLSVWTPSSVTHGLMVLDIAPPLWWCIVSICAAFAGLLWVTVGERLPSLRHTGPLLVLYVLILWQALTAGSLLMMLAMWSLFDIVWFLGRSSGAVEGERGVWGVTLSGIASLLLWIVSFFLLEEGASGLWWLMRPSASSFNLLLVAACLRLGFYPFQVVHAESWGRARSLTLAGAISPLLGVGLLYRLLSLPGQGRLSDWLVVWAGLSVFWSGVKALTHSGRGALLPAAYGLLLALVTGAVITDDPESLVLGAGIWVACLALLAIARRYERRGFAWSWSTVIAVLVLMGAPPSPLLRLYHGALDAAPLGVLLLYLVGLLTAVAALVRGSAQQAEGRVTPAYGHRALPMAVGMAVLVVTVLAASLAAEVPTIAPLPFALWVLATVGGCFLALRGERILAIWHRAHTLHELLDLDWFYGSVWQGANNLLGVLRVTADVVEGRGSVLWSVLILLLVLMVAGGR